MLTWRERIARLDPACVVAPPASGTALHAAERALGVALPAELAALLRESNGVDDEYGASVVWTAEDIAQNNQAYRNDPDFATLFMPFDCLLFFADAGDGDLFGYATLAGAVRTTTIFRWSHETDSRVWQAASLAQYLEGRLGGQPGTAP